MALPKAIQRQADEAAAAEAAISQQVTQTDVVMNDPAQLIPANEPVSAQPQPVEPQPPAPPPADDWQQKYKSLQGMFAQKTGELQTQNRQYESQLAQMQKQIDALSQTRKQDEQKANSTADPKDVENFGADLIEMVQRYAERVFQGMADQFGGKAAEMDGRLALAMLTRRDSTVVAREKQRTLRLERQVLAVRLERERLELEQLRKDLSPLDEGGW